MPLKEYTRETRNRSSRRRFEEDPGLQRQYLVGQPHLFGEEDLRSLVTTAARAMPP